MNAGLSLYLHIPFCSTKCTYCAFNTYIKLERLIAPFVTALTREIGIVGESQPGQRVRTIYFGGGTPSLLAPAQFEAVLAAIDRHFDVQPDAEISVEANPNDLDADYALALRSIGINRLSIGMQSAHDGELKLFHRRHDARMVEQAVSAARDAGFENLNLDLIYGIPRQSLDDWHISLLRAVELQPEHISLYALGLEDGTPMQRWVASGYLPSPDDDLVAEMYDLATEALHSAGYQQYEISNWAKPGFACRHNLQYWRNLPYIGLGPGAHGYAGGVRYSTVLQPQQYIHALREADAAYKFPCTPATAEAVCVDQASEIAETLIMGLRLVQEGIQRPVFVERFGADVVELHRPTIEKFAGYGLLEVTPESVRLTPRARLLSNVIFRELV